MRANWAQRAAEASHGLTADHLTPWVETSAYGLRRAWNAAKPTVAPWWAQNSKEAYASGYANLAAAPANRSAGRTRMPRLQSKRRSRRSCRFSTGAVGLGEDRRHIRLPVIGTARTAESTRKLARTLDAGRARIRSATLSFQRGRWHVAFSVELADTEPVVRTRGRLVGVDLGISPLATLSTGAHIPNGRRLDHQLRTLRRAQRVRARRRGPDRRTSVQPSNRWRTARARADRIHTRVANLRRNHTHQFTTRLVGEYDLIVIEDLHVAGMLRNRRLARHITGAAWAEIRRQLTYKTQRTGARLIVANRWYASSKTYSECRTITAGGQHSLGHPSVGALAAGSSAAATVSHPVPPGKAITPRPPRPRGARRVAWGGAVAR